MESKNIVRVVKNKDYTVINNTSLYDTKLSWKAKAIHVFMLSKPDDWTFHNSELTQWATDGDTSFDTGLKELKKYGYVKKERRRGKNGKFEWVTVVYEVPQLDGEQEQPIDKQPLPDSPSMENPPMVEPYPEKPSMENPRVEKPLVENQGLLNTNIPSTDLLSTDRLINDNDDKEPPASTASENQTAPPTQNAFAFYEQNHFGALGSLIIFKIDQWINDLSEPLVIHAMEKAVLNGKTNWGYVETILKDWYNKKLFTLEAVEAADLQWKNQQIQANKQQRNQTKKYYQQKNRREEVVPGWFDNRHDAVPNDVTESTSTMDFEAERQKILEMLGKG